MLFFVCPFLDCQQFNRRETYSIECKSSSHRKIERKRERNEIISPIYRLCSVKKLLQSLSLKKHLYCSTENLHVVVETKWMNDHTVHNRVEYFFHMNVRCKSNSPEYYPEKQNSYPCRSLYCIPASCSIA